ncbi:MAG: LysR family transcriptional regulator [Bacteroidales bacterium]|nr:LysR family transcriptional regulator [Bacteroidales bacterium]
MTLQQLEYIVAVDEHRYFVKAAEACGVTQSTLSLMIKKLEEEWDVTIFRRNTHPVEATETGRKLIEEAKMVLYHTKQLVELTQSEKELASGPLRVGMISTVAPVLMPKTFGYLSTFYPDIKLQALEMRSAAIVESLKKAEIDMGVLTSPINDKELLELPLYHERFFAYIVDEEILDTHESIERSRLKDYPLWVMKDGIRLFDQKDLSQQHQNTYEELYEGGRVGILIQIANENGGITILPETHLNLLDEQAKQRLRPIVGSTITRVISLVMRKDYIHEKMMNIFVKAIKSCISPDFYEHTIKGDYIKI